MNKVIRIEQHHFSKQTETDINNYFILVEFRNGIPVKSYIVKFPEAFRFWDDKYPFYCPNQN